MKQAAFLLLLAGLASLLHPFLYAQQSGQAEHAPSGGTRMTVISIAVPPIPNAPFTATVSTEWIRNLDDGSTVKVQNRRMIARDNMGRVFQERRNLYPAGDPRGSQIRQLEFADPRSRVIYYCQPDAETCEIQTYYPPAAAAPSVPAGPLNDGKGFLTRVDLGTDTVAGVEAVGTRETTTINAGAIGNDRALQVVKEFWYSSQLGINLIEKRQDPRVGTQTFVVSDISLGEPDARLFDLPAGFRVVDLRKGNQPSGESSGSN